jgi:uncharacterized membrane protein
MLIGFTILIFGIIRNNTVLRKTSYFLFIVVGVSAILSNVTGERAEKTLEKHVEKTYINLNSVDAVQQTAEQLHQLHERIEKHESDAKGMMPFMFGLIGLSALSLLLEYKKKSNTKTASFILLLIVSLAIFFAIQTGNSGGKVNHPEISVH